MATPVESAEETEVTKVAAEKEVSEETTTTEKTEEPKEEEKSEVASEEADTEETVPLSSHTKTKDVLFRIASKLLGDEDELQKLAESDPKLLERIKAEFPKKFKDVVVPEENLEAKLEAMLDKRLKTSGKGDALEALREELKMTKMEFEDIREEVASKADRYLELELAESHKDAVLLAYKDLNPKKYKDLVTKQAAKEIGKRQLAAKSGSGTSGETKHFSKQVLDNYKKLGFKDPQQMVDYQDPKKLIKIF